MATFCYSDLAGGPVWEREFPMGLAPEGIDVQGLWLLRDYAAEGKGNMHVRVSRHAKKGRARNVDPWRKHYSLSMGARTPEHAMEIREKCAEAKVVCEFDKHLRLKVNGRKHQEKLAKVVFPNKKIVNKDGF